MHTNLGDVIEDVDPDSKTLNQAINHSDALSEFSMPSIPEAKEGALDQTDPRLLKTPGQNRTSEKIPLRAARAMTEMQIVASGDDYFLARCGEARGAQFYELRFHTTLSDTFTDETVARLVGESYEKIDSELRIEPKERQRAITNVIRRSGARPDHKLRLKNDAEGIRFIAEGVGVLSEDAWSGGLWVLSHAVPVLVRVDPEIHGHTKIDIAVGHFTKSRVFEGVGAFELRFKHALQELVPDLEVLPEELVQRQRETLNEREREVPSRRTNHNYLDDIASKLEETHLSTSESSPSIRDSGMDRRMQALEDQMRKQGRIK